MLPLQQFIYDAEEKMKKSIASVIRQFGEVRGGRANPSLVEHLTIAYYGTPTPLKQLAAITAPDARMLVVQPWDANALPEIEKALLQSELGVTPVRDGKLLRLPVPPLTAQRRQDLTKLVHKMAEEDRVSIRTLRRDANEHIKKLKSDKQTSEDDAFKAQTAIQKLTDKYIAQIDELLKAKEQELLSA